MRVFLDTNVIASATATRGLCADVFRSVIEFHELVVSDTLFQEIKRVLREKFDASDALIADVLWLLQQDTIFAESKPLAELHLKDSADIAMVSSAINGRAELFVTGDKEILALKRVHDLEIVSPRQFWERIKGQPPESA